MALLTGTSDASLLPRVLAHYHRVAPLIATHLAGTPIVYRNFPAGLGSDGHYAVTDEPLTANALLHEIHAKYALEFFTWAPLPEDEHRLRYARILLEVQHVGGAPPFPRVRDAAKALREHLRTRGLDAIPLVDGLHGIALWVPLADAPEDRPLRVWLHALVNQAAAAHPELISTEANTHRDGRVHVHVSSNAARRYSAVPYCWRVRSGGAICTPLTWAELDTLTASAAFPDTTFAQRLAEHGDVFAHQLAAIGEQRFADASQTPALLSVTTAPRGHIITAALEILADGKSRTAQELLADAQARKLVDRGTKANAFYIRLIEYIARLQMRGRKPPIVQTVDRRFRINEPLDDWPDVAPLAAPSADPAADALCARLAATMHGANPTAFEATVCDAFAHLGFRTQHLGGRTEPDGVADAILGRLGYRVLLECKTAKTIVPQPDVVEVAKHREAYGAQYCVMVGPEWPNDLEFLDEMHEHGVAALAIEELQTLLHLRANAHELKALLKPGYVSDLLGDLQWTRRHGPAKQVATVAYYIIQEGWKAQEVAAEQGGPANAPILTIDAAMLLVDAALRNAGSAQACTRDQVEAAFAWLESANVRLGLRDNSGIVVLNPERDQ